MCRICEGRALNVRSFYDFKIAANRVSNYSTLREFINQARVVDKLRFDSGDEWGEPRIIQSVSGLIFSNPNTDEGLLLFTLGCWLDTQAKYQIVWNNYLRQARLWLQGRGTIPRGGFEPTSKHLLQTTKFLKDFGCISLWFASKINQIVKEKGKAKGNIYRIAGELCNDLYQKPEAANQLKEGVLPKMFSGGDHKRFWMYLMFLRRDNSIIKCLFTRALSEVKGGSTAVRYWFDDEYFNPIECELPVDTWVLTNWNGMAKKLNLPGFTTNYTAQVALKARELAQKVDMSPSALDAMLFYS